MRRAPALAAALALAAGCARCAGRRPGPPPERHLPAVASLLVVLPEVERAALEAGSLLRTLAAVPAAAQLDDAAAAVRSQLGFDPLDPRSLEEAGVDPRGGAGAALGAGPLLLVLPVADAGRLEATAARLARDRMGAGLRETATSSGVEAVVFRRERGGPAALSYAVVDGYALLATGPRSPEAVATAAALPSSQALGGSPAWSAARGALGKDPSVLAFAPAGSPLLADLPGVRDGAALGLRSGTAGLALRAAVLLRPDRAASLEALVGPGREEARRAGLEEVSRLPPDAALVIRWGGDPGALGARLLPRLPPRARDALSAARVDLGRDLFENLAPGAAASVSLAPTFTVAEFSSPRFDPRRSDPFRLVAVEALARVKDPARARALFARLGAAAPRWGARLASRPAPDGGSWVLSWGAAQLGWSLSGDRLAVAGGAGRLEALERRAAGGAAGYAPPSAASREALGAGPGAALLDVRNLVAAVQALPQEAYGTGPNGFVVRSLVDRFLEPASHVRAATLRFDVRGGTAIVDLEVEGRETREAGRP